MSRTPKSPKSGGRQRGSKNKVTLEREAEAERARQIIEAGRPVGRKFSREVLEDFMTLFAGMAAAHQPLPPGAVVEAGRRPNEAQFEKWARLAVDTAAKLAPYQHPTYRAIVAMVPPPVGDQSAPVEGKVIGRIGDPARVYQQMIGKVA